MKTIFKPSFFCAALVAAATFCCASPQQPESKSETMEPVASMDSPSTFRPFELPGYGAGKEEMPGKHVVHVLMAPGWGTGSLAVARIEEAAASIGLVVEVLAEEVPAAAKAPAGYKGSPTIFIRGLDLDPSARGLLDSGHGWRTYADASPDNAGVPSEKMMIQGFREAGWIEWVAFYPAVTDCPLAPSGFSGPNSAGYQ